jgi:hypothetical protein
VRSLTRVSLAKILTQITHLGEPFYSAGAHPVNSFVARFLLLLIQLILFDVSFRPFIQDSMMLGSYQIRFLKSSVCPHRIDTPSCISIGHDSRLQFCQDDDLSCTAPSSFALSMRKLEGVTDPPFHWNPPNREYLARTRVR